MHLVLIQALAHVEQKFAAGRRIALRMKAIEGIVCVSLVEHGLVVAEHAVAGNESRDHICAVVISIHPISSG